MVENPSIFPRIQCELSRSQPAVLALTRFVRTLYCVFLMHHRKDLWSPDGESLGSEDDLHALILPRATPCFSVSFFLLSTADLFDPDRFLDERPHKYLVPNPFIFLPFNAGPRWCGADEWNFSLRTTRYRISSFGCCSRSMVSRWQIGRRPRDVRRWRRSY